MTSLMAALFEYASSTHLPDYRSDPEYKASERRFDEAEAALHALLDEEGKRLLDELLNENMSQSSLETYAFFEAALAVSGELHTILQPH